MPKEQGPSICGKPITPWYPLGADDQAGPPVHAGMVVAVYTICCLPPEHEGRCVEAKVARLPGRPCTEGVA